MRRFWSSSSETPTIERVAVTLVERRLRRALSVDWSFLCALRYSAVHASLLAFSLLLNRRLHLALRKRKTWQSVRASLIPWTACQNGAGLRAGHGVPGRGRSSGR